MGGPPCIGQPHKLSCHDQYLRDLRDSPVWLMNGEKVQNRQDFIINGADRSLTLLNVKDSKHTGRIIFQCGVSPTAAPQLQVFGEHYSFQPLGQT